MRNRTRVLKTSVAITAACWLAWGSFARTAAAAEVPYMDGVNLDAARLIAVQHDGRFKTLDTLAREMIRHITGKDFFEREVVGGKPIKQDPVYTYLDLIFNPQNYQDLRLIFIKKKPIREALTRAALGSVSKTELNQILEDGRVSLSFLQLPAVQAKMDELSRDVMRTAQEVNMLIDAAGLANAQSLKDLMRVIPPPQAASAQERWFSITSLEKAAPEDDVHAGMNTGSKAIPDLDPQQQAGMSGAWMTAGRAWQSGDAAAATLALNALAGSLSQIAPSVYPPHRKLALEHWYYQYNKMTWTWIPYMVSVVFLLMGIVYKWPRARATGVGFFSLAFMMHTVASGIRWYLAGRIPNSNMFEAVTAAAWFGAAIAAFFELGPIMARRPILGKVSWVLIIGGLGAWLISIGVRGIPYSAWQDWGPVPTASLIACAVGCIARIATTVAGRYGAGTGLLMLGAATVAMVAMMCGRFMTISLDSDISIRMPVLNDLWLYIHTNMIITSYALIGIAYVTAAMYVIGRLLTEPTRNLWMSMVIPAVVVPLPALPDISARVASLFGRPMHAEWPITLMMILPAWIPFLLVIALVLIGRLIRLIGGRKLGDQTYAAWNGDGGPAIHVREAVFQSGLLAVVVGTVATASSAGGAPTRTARPRQMNEDGMAQGLAQVLDGATMLFMELSFITLWTGIIMGAIWADHSWGRPWGWDPKEVFALNTWIIFLILVHVRIKVKDKALWTAVLAVIGCAVMLFNWIVVNFFITGLHSYA